MTLARAPRDKHLCLLITLNVRNVFYTVPWPAIDETLRRKDVSTHLVKWLRLYIKNRVFMVIDESKYRIMEMNTGILQNSVLRLILLNF